LDRRLRRQDHRRRLEGVPELPRVSWGSPVASEFRRHRRPSHWLKTSCEFSSLPPSSPRLPSCVE
jgi:hypothetical protein